MPASQPRLLYITGHGHSGSTLLDILLGNHSRVVSLGEVEHLAKWGASADPQKSCSCNKPISDCPYWSSVRVAIRRETREESSDADGRAFWRDFDTTHHVPESLIKNRFHLLEGLLVLGWAPILRGAASLSPYIRQYQRLASNNWSLFDAVQQLSAPEFIVDSSKLPVRLKLLHLARPASFSCVHLSRDGRAIVASYKRRRGWPVEVSARMWAQRMRNIKLVMRTLPDDRVFRIRYEDLAVDPVSELERLCYFLGLNYEEGMLARRDRDLHNICGNPMRLGPDAHRDIRLDDRWKRELSTGELSDFERIAGRMNARLGYH